MGKAALLAAFSLLVASSARAAPVPVAAPISPPVQAYPDGLPAALLVAAEASLVLDMLQTSSAIHAGLQESNPILGPRPSDGKLLAYFGGCMFVTAAATLLLPDSIRTFAPSIVLMVEIPQIAQNASVRWGLRLPF